MTENPNILTYDEMADTLLAKMRELSEEKEHNVKMRTRFNNALTALLMIKQTYPHIFDECVTKDMLDSICEEKCHG